MSANMWSYPPESSHTPGTRLIGFKVEASDGHIGKVDEHTEDVGASYLVVDTGPWIFGKHVLIPAGTVVRVDVKEEKIHVNLTKDQIKDSPAYDKDKHRGDPVYRDQLGLYYGHDHS
ncbi:PRC-barrel domain-containing protein [Streptomyces sp. NPDC054865]